VLGGGGFRGHCPLPLSIIERDGQGREPLGTSPACELAHDRALELFRSPGVALPTQYALLALMVVYTGGGLWLPSQD
jgi:hypothetical protein